MLWSVLAPVGAMLCVGVRQSLGWFIAWVVLTALSGDVDYYLADALLAARRRWCRCASAWCSSR